jgi:hypothetical protein
MTEKQIALSTAMQHVVEAYAEHTRGTRETYIDSLRELGLDDDDISVLLACDEQYAAARYRSINWRYLAAWWTQAGRDCDYARLYAIYARQWHSRWGTYPNKGQAATTPTALITRLIYTVRAETTADEWWDVVAMVVEDYVQPARNRHWASWDGLFLKTRK